MTLPLNLLCIQILDPASQLTVRTDPGPCLSTYCVYRSMTLHLNLLCVQIRDPASLLTVRTDP